MRVAVLDLGSTSFRLVVADCDPGIGLVPRVQRRKHLNLGMVVGREGRIPEPHASAAVKAVTKLRRRAELSGTDRIVAVATSALRDAGNGQKVARRLAAAAGVPVHILSGDEEAALTFRALQAGCRWPRAFGGALRGARAIPFSGSTSEAAAWSWRSGPAPAWTGPRASSSEPPGWSAGSSATTR